MAFDVGFDQPVVQREKPKSNSMAFDVGFDQPVIQREQPR